MHLKFENRNQLIISSLIVVAFVFSLCINCFADLKTWTPIDWGAISEKFSSSLDKQTYICYPTGSGLPIFAKRGAKAIIDNLERLPVGDEHFFLLFGNHINGIGPDRRSKSFNFEDPIPKYKNNDADISYNIYKLKNILLLKNNTSKKFKFIFASIRPLSPSNAERLKESIFNSIPGEWIFCNSWFNQTVTKNKTQEKHIAYLLLCRMEDNYNLDLLKNAAKKRKKEIGFYVISP